MAHVPAILQAWDAARVQRVLRRASAQPAANFTPSHIISGRGVLGGTASDLIGDWHLVSEGGAAVNTRASFGQASNYYVPAMRVEKGASQAWVAQNLTSWNFASYFAVLMIVRFVVDGGGGYFIGNLRGPDIGDPHPLGGDPWESPDYGDDLGWGISANGNGGMGAGIYGDAAEPGRFDINNDCAGGTEDANLADGEWRCIVLAYHSSTPNMRLTAADSGAQTFDAGTPGTITSPDVFRFGAVNYFGNQVNTATIEIASLIAFTDATVVGNVWTNHQKIVDLIQADLDAA
jgi:hypothetical protein